MDDYFAAERLILDRLQGLSSHFRLIGSGRSLKDLPLHPGPVPALYLLYDGQIPYRMAGQEQAIDQRWLLVTVVRSAREVASGTYERMEAGPLLIQVCGRLLGWSPSEIFGPLTLHTTPAPLIQEGFGYYPLGLTTRVVLNGF